MKKKNYLDFVPGKNPDLSWSVDENEIVTVDVKHRGIAAKVAQVAFNRPKVSHVKLEKFGSFIWTQIDGEKNIYEIGQAVKKKFGKEAEPLYERLAAYFKILQDNNYIRFKR